MNQHNILFVVQIHNKTRSLLWLYQVSKINILNEALTKAYQVSS